MSLIPYVEYNESSDKLVGFENSIIFDHVLVFMVKGVIGNWKQAIVYSFCKSTTKSLELNQLIKDIVRTVNSQTELKISSLICDQGSTNRTAVESLVKESSGHYLQRNMSPKRCLLIDSYEVVPLYNVPHLIKGIRKNLLTKDLIWVQQKTVLKATWRDIISAYKIDDCRHELKVIKMLGKIKPRHINPDQRGKMKVAYAKQVLSNSMAVTIFSMAKNSKCWDYNML
ncbi:uncharacterized protein LOC143376139 [Andrena cerasifolii]|uniref:uncharacterized protein LOC143376139 n=1 Tax=Andrena cerasifolii TaxID=2819439 RepID=UPI0040381A92